MRSEKPFLQWRVGSYFGQNALRDKRGEVVVGGKLLFAKFNGRREKSLAVIYKKYQCNQQYNIFGIESRELGESVSSFPPTTTSFGVDPQGLFVVRR